MIAKEKQAMSSMHSVNSTARETVERQFDALNRHDPQAWAANYSPDAVALDPQHPEPLKGREAIAADVFDFIAAFPDLQVELNELLGNADGYAIEFTMRGTHKGPLLGPSGHIPATNRRMEVRGSAFARLGVDGRIVEERRHYDLAGVLSQLGLMR
jgi:steroid delta-isomerase-like uncharacterized protein